MPKVIYSMAVSLDGFVAGPRGELDWSVPDEELHRFHNEQTRELGALFCGRRLYEVMAYWETVDESALTTEYELEFARLWRELPKVVFSTTLDDVVGNARLAGDDVAEEVARLKAEAGKDLGVGGPGLASTFIRQGLIDEYRLFICPVVLGGGTPFFPPTSARIDADLLETRTFGSRVAYVRYGRAGGP
jgi:dihydrofolate reductase